MDPEEILRYVRRTYIGKVDMSIDEDIARQLKRLGGFSQLYTISVFDAETGIAHTFNLVGVEQRTHSFVFWDPASPSPLSKEHFATGVIYLILQSHMKRSRNCRFSLLD